MTQADLDARIDGRTPNNGTRECPTLRGDARSLITHRIVPSRCLGRQRENYHKCHRCVYRGRAANWVHESAPSLSGLVDTGLPSGVDIPR